MNAECPRCSTTYIGYTTANSFASGMKHPGYDIECHNCNWSGYMTENEFWVWYNEDNY